jgi:hypothetical protein
LRRQVVFGEVVLRRQVVFGSKIVLQHGVVLRRQVVFSWPRTILRVTQK